jgi:RNA polymerase sigma factor (sigma-70 family)
MIRTAARTFRTAAGNQALKMNNDFLDTTTDAASISRSLAEPRAFAVLFDRHFDAIYGYAARRAGRDLGEEVAAETFARAFDARRRYDLSHESARPWLLGIATHLLCRHWREERRRIAAYGRLAEQRETVVEAPATPAELLASALGALSGRDRETLFLFVWADLSYEEIGTALEVPVGTVRSRIARARRVLRDRLGCAALDVPVMNVLPSQEPHNV